MCLKLKASFLQWESQQLFYMYWEVCRVTFAAELNLSSFHLGMKHPGEGGCSRSIWKCFVSGDLEKPRNLGSLVAVASASGMQVADLTIFGVIAQR